MDSDEVIMFILERLAPSLAGSVVFAVHTREMSHAARDSGAAPAGDDLGCSHLLHLPTYFGGGMFRGGTSPRPSAYSSLIPALGPLEPTLLKAEPRGAECQHGESVAHGMGFSSVKWAGGAHCVGCKPPQSALKQTPEEDLRVACPWTVSGQLLCKGSCPC